MIESQLPHLTPEALRGYPDEYLLFFWADTTRFLVQPPDPATFKDHESVSDNVHACKPTIHNAIGALVGSACRMKGEHWAGDFHARWFDFVAIARRAVAELPEFPATILALQIEWRGSVARRVNLAEIGEEEWLAARPSTVLVALE